METWEHKQDLVNLLASLQVPYKQSIFVFAIGLIAISDYHRASINLTGTETSYDIESGNTKDRDIRSLEKGIFNIKSDYDLPVFKRKLGT